MKALANSRRFTRTPISTPVLMRPTGAIEFEEGTSIDISGSGISVVLKQEPSEVMLKALDAYLQFEIQGKEEPDVLVEVSADVVRRDDFPTSPNLSTSSFAKAFTTPNKITRLFCVVSLKNLSRPSPLQGIMNIDYQNRPKAFYLQT